MLSSPNACLIIARVSVSHPRFVQNLMHIRCRSHCEIASGQIHYFKFHHLHPTAWYFAHWLPRYASTIIYRYISLLQLLYRHVQLMSHGTDVILNAHGLNHRISQKLVVLVGLRHELINTFCPIYVVPIPPKRTNSKPKCSSYCCSFTFIEKKKKCLNKSSISSNIC
jgi:hypothetical protein